MKTVQFIFLFLISIPLLSQQDFVITDIAFQGLVKNKEDYLRQFIISKLGEKLDLTKVETDLIQLNRRTGVAKASFQLDTLVANQITLTYKIREQKTLIPQFGLGGIKANFWWQVGLAEFNLNGKGKTLVATFLSNDKRPNGQLYFENNWINGSKWGYALDIARAASIEPLFFSSGDSDFKYTNTRLGISGLYNPTLNNQLRFGIDIFQENYEKVSSESTPGPTLLDQNKILLNAIYNINRISYDYFYRTGSESNLLLQSVFTFGEEEVFLSFTYELRKYWKPYTSANIALRLRAAIASNSPSPFAPFVLDSRVNIRGVGNRVDRGTAQLVINLEYRQTLIHKDNYAAQLVFFADSGTWRNPGGSFNELFDKSQFRQFVGAGIRWINKKVFKSVIRVDYGTDLWNLNQSGVVVGLGQYF